jgi:hypothetical protein
MVGVVAFDSRTKRPRPAMLADQTIVGASPRSNDCVGQDSGSAVWENDNNNKI